MKIWYSIRTKFLAVMSLLLGVCVLVYLGLATMVFKNDKTELVFDLNRSQVTTIASELELQMQSLSDKLKLYASTAQGGALVWVNDLLREDSDLGFVALFKADGTSVERHFVNKKFLDTYQVRSRDVLAKAIAEQKNIKPKLSAGRDYISRLQVDEHLSVLVYSRAVEVLKENGKTEVWSVVGWLTVDGILKSMSESRLSDLMVVNANAEVLIDSSFIKNAGNTADLSVVSSVEEHPLFQAAKQNPIRTQVMSFQSKEDKYLGAFSKAFHGQMIVLAQTNEGKAFAVLGTLIERSLIFALMTLTLAVLVAVFLSRSLTDPISSLAETMETVGKGDLSAQAHVTTKDETAILAQTFNRMIQDLKTSRDELEKMNKELDLKVKERTLQLEQQNQAVKTAQEALLKTTRLASAGEIAGRAAHEVLNPLTGILTRIGLMEKRVQKEVGENITFLDEMRTAWSSDYSSGGFDKLVQNWSENSQLYPEKNLWLEDLYNLEQLSHQVKNTMQTLLADSQFIQSEGARINRIIHGMRKLSATQAELKASNVHDLLKDCVHIMGDLFDAENSKLVMEFNASVKTAKVDRDEFIQAVTNLLRNSLQAIQSLNQSGFDRSAQPQVKVTTKNHEHEIWIEIEDNGVGIKLEDQARVFDTHFTTKSADDGTGLGLGIARRFIRAHGGDILLVDSKPLQATVFRIVLPAVVESVKGAAA